MKKFLKFFMFISFILILALIGCPTSTSDTDDDQDQEQDQDKDKDKNKDQDQDKDKELVSGLTITGLEDYEGQYVIAITNISNTTLLFGVLSVDKDSMGVIGNKIVDGKVDLALFVDLDDKYTGNAQDVDFMVVIQESNDKFNLDESDTIYNSIAGKVNADFNDGVGEGEFVQNNGLLVVVPHSEYQDKYALVLSDKLSDLIMASGDKNADEIKFIYQPLDGDNEEELIEFEGKGGLIKNGFTMLNVYTYDIDEEAVVKFTGNTVNMKFNIRFLDDEEFELSNLVDSPDGDFQISFKNGIGVGIF